MPVTKLGMETTNLNLATTVRWLAIIPFQSIDKSLNSKNTAFNLTSYNLPEIAVGSNEVTQYGYSVEVPNYVRSHTKEVTFEYLISSDWHQYKVLHHWFNKIVSEDGSGTGESENLGEMVLPIRLLMLSEFKHPIFEIIYHNCWIKSFDAVSLDYQDDGAANIKHDFLVSYSHYTFNDDF